MLRAYQSEEDDESAEEVSTTDSGDEVDSDEADDGSNNNIDSSDEYTDTDVDRQLDSGSKKLWWQELGPCTRRGPRINYSENKRTKPRAPTPKVGV